MTQRAGLTRREYQRCIEPLLDRAAAYAYAIVRNREDAEDAVQEASLKGYRALASYDRSRPFKGWWLALLRNCSKDLLRRRATRPSTAGVDPAELSGELPSASRHRTDQTDALWAALRQLTPAHREILELRYFGDCSYREIATALGIPEGTVMSRLHAARQSLASIYRKADP